MSTSDDERPVEVYKAVDVGPTVPAGVTVVVVVEGVVVVEKRALVVVVVVVVLLLLFVPEEMRADASSIAFIRSRASLSLE